MFSLLFKQNHRYRFTQIAVDPQIKTPGGKTYDVIFVGTGEYHSDQPTEMKEQQFECHKIFSIPATHRNVIVLYCMHVSCLTELLWMGLYVDGMEFYFSSLPHSRLLHEIFIYIQSGSEEGWIFTVWLGKIVLLICIFCTFSIEHFFVARAMKKYMKNWFYDNITGKLERVFVMYWKIIWKYSRVG